LNREALLTVFTSLDSMLVGVLLYRVREIIEELFQLSFPAIKVSYLDKDIAKDIKNFVN